MKIIAHEWTGGDHPQIYNAMDAGLTWEINDIFKDLPDSGPIYNFSLALQAPVLEMQLRGIRVDPHARNQALSKLKLDLKSIEIMLEKFAAAVWDRSWVRNPKGEPTFPNSQKQLTEFFYDRMGIPAIMRKQKGEEKMPMDRDVLEKLEQYFQAWPIARAIISYRDIAGKIEVLETQVDEDWRIRTSINIAATSTGRFSSSQSSTGTGGNIQNITEDLRNIFISDPGMKIAGIDKQQAEAREVGFLCGVLFDDWSYLNMIEGGDPHTYCCRLVWKNLPWTGDIKLDRKIADQNFYRHYTYRDMSKRAGHGSNYLGKSWAISQQLKVPQHLVESFQEAYFEAFPCISMMHNWVSTQLQTKQYLVNVFGRRRDFFDRSDSNENLKKAIAYLFQSATADDLNLGMWRVWKYMGNRIQLLLQLHDAIYFQYSEDDNEEEVIKSVQEHLTIPLYHKGRKFTVPTDCLVGHNMQHRYKRDKDGNKIDANPRGLDEPAFARH